MITAFIGREAFEALQAGREPSPKMTREKVFDDDVMVIVPMQPATREGCKYVVSDGRLCAKCGHIHRRELPPCPRCNGERTIDQTGYGEYRPCPDCNPESPYYEYPTPGAGA